MKLPLERRFWPAFGAICLLWGSTAVAIRPVESNDVETGSLATDLDQAVNDLAAGRLDQATAHFERLCSDRGQAAFVRALRVSAWPKQHGCGMIGNLLWQHGVK